ncbi:molybdenum cofactor guanylyltransferase [Caldisphaera lagunensis]|nr:nucleotidyltransferase family protein [Caldisphaera lagunensis]
MEIAAIILAGGKSTRFAEDKLIYLYNNKPIISYPINESEKITDNVFVVTNDKEYEKLRKVINVEFIFDDPSFKCEGSSRGIASAIKAIDANYYLIMPGDIPWIHYIALKNLLEYAKRTQYLVSPIIYSGIVSPLFLAFPKSYKDNISRICDEYSVLASRPSNFIRGNKSLLIGSYHLTDNPRVFYDVDTKLDLTTHTRGLPRKIVYLESYKYFIDGIENLKNGENDEAFKDFINESKIYKINKLNSLELSCLIDAFLINKDEKIQKRINVLRKKLGRRPKEY